MYGYCISMNSAVSKDNEKALVSFSDISFSYRQNGHRIFSRLSMDIEPGTVTVIRGPNGAGKTTLLHLATGWLKPEWGTVLLRGVPLKQFSRREIGKIMALVPQSEHMSFEYSLLEYTVLGRAPHLKATDMPSAEDFKIALESLAQVGLADQAYRSIIHISGGELQLVMIARALTQQPEILILDEPSSHLDLSNKAKLVHLIRSFQSKGKTVILTTHEPEVAAACATHAVLMRQGEVLFVGTMEKALTEELLSATYRMNVSVGSHNGRPTVVWS